MSILIPYYTSNCFLVILFDTDYTSDYDKMSFGLLPSVERDAVTI